MSALSPSEERGRYLHYLRMAKSFLVRGDVERAKIFLDKPFPPETNIYPTKRRYDALVAFLEKDYKKSLTILEEDIFRPPSRAREICLQKLLSMALARARHGFQREFHSCLRLTGPIPEDRALWLNALAKKPGPLERLSQDNRMAKAQIKLALFSGQEENIIKLAPTMRAEHYEFQEIRELLGLTYERMNQESLAQNFLEGIDSPNADILRGHRALEKQDYALAFQEIERALQKRPLSISALNRALPLTILLGKWSQGALLAEAVGGRGGKRGDALSLKSFFSLRMGNMERAKDYLANLSILLEKQNNPTLSPTEMTMMSGYVALIQGDKRELEALSYEVCKSFGKLSCWIFHQQILWENITETISREDSPHRDFDMEALKKKVAIVPLVEEAIGDGHNFHQ